MRSRFPRLARVLGAVAVVAVVAVVTVLLHPNLHFTVRQSAEEREVVQRAEAVLALIQNGDLTAAASLIGPECDRPRIAPYGLESIERVFKDKPFTHDLFAADVSTTQATAIGDIQWETPWYGHRISVNFRRAQNEGPWVFCAIGVAGYS